MKDMNSLSHTKWNCKYHIVFAPKYRRKAFYGSNRLEIGAILRELCSWKEVTIIESEVCPDHVHMFVEIPPKLSISTFMGYLKEKSSVMIYKDGAIWNINIEIVRFGVEDIILIQSEKMKQQYRNT